MNVCMMIKNQAGMIGLFTVLTDHVNRLIGVVCYDDLTRNVCRQLNLPVYNSVNDNCFIEKLRFCDLLVCVHGSEIVGKEFLGFPIIGCINVHPCLSMFKGSDPIERLLRTGGSIASVGCHWMSDRVDMGEIIYEEFIDVSGCSSVEEVYNRLYPLYFNVLNKSLLSPEINGVWGSMSLMVGEQ